MGGEYFMNGNSVSYGQGSTFDASDKNLYLNIEKEIKKFPAPRIELLKRLGSFDQQVLSHKIEWSRRDNRPVKSTMAVDANASATTMIVTDAGVFNVDDLIQLPSGEQKIVTAVTGGTQLTVKAWTGTPEAVGIGDTIMRIGMATAQGKDADDMVISGYEDLYNFTSILEDVVNLSGTENEALIRGHENSGQLIARKEQELMEVLQSQLVLGKRNKDDATKTTTLGGLKYMIDTYASDNAVNFGGSGTWTGTGDSGPIGKVDDMLDKISAKAFDKPVLYVGSKFMRKFKYAIEDSTITSDRKDGERGIGVIGKFNSHLYGKIDVVLIQERTGYMDDLVFAIDESGVGYKPERNRGWHTYQLGRKGDSFQWQVVGEYTLKIDNPSACAYMHTMGL
jgi:hypothetical protein